MIPQLLLLSSLLPSILFLTDVTSYNPAIGAGALIGSAIGYMVKTIKTHKKILGEYSQTNEELISTVREIRAEQIRSRVEFNAFGERLARLEGVERVRVQAAGQIS